MGWTLSSIIINPVTAFNAENLLGKLGFENLTEVEAKSYDVVMYPDKETVYIGNYKDNLIICADNLPLNFFDRSLSDTEKILIDYFPNAEISAVSLQSAINHFGFAVIKKGEKIRVKAGDADIGTAIDFGEPIEQEKELLSKSKVDSNGQRVYYLDGPSNEPYLENQVGENIIFEIFRRYTGASLDEDDDLLDTSLKGYKFTSGAFSYDQYFSGTWQGEYSYGEGYRDLVRGKIEVFTLDLSLTNGEIKGACIDGNKQSDQPATIRGFLFDTFIGFIKEYPFRYVFDDKGETQKEVSKQSNNISYSGLYDPLTDTFKGIWRIENKKFWGEWKMKRKKN